MKKEREMDTNLEFMEVNAGNKISLFIIIIYFLNNDGYLTKLH